MGWNINGALVLALAVLLYQYVTLHRQLAEVRRSFDTPEQQSGKPIQKYASSERIEQKPAAEKKDVSQLLVPTENHIALLHSGSSVWCRGEHMSRRLCRFRSICLHPKKLEFLFLHGPDTVISGLEQSDDKKPIVDLASVENHNALQMVPTDVLATKVQELYHNIKMIEHPTLLLYRFKPDNLMHVFHDDLLPLFHTLLEVSGGPSISQRPLDVLLALVDSWPEGPHSPLYSLFTSSPPLSMSSMEEDTLFCFKDAYAGLNRHTLWYQYGFRVPQGPLENRTVTSIDIRHFTNFLSRNLPQIVPSSCDTPVAVFLSRKSTRLVMNENEVIDTIAQESGLAVEVLSLDDASLVDLIGHIQCANILVGMHGALLVLAMFLKPGSVFIELYPYAIPPDEYTPYKTLVSLPGMGIIYKTWSNEQSSNTITHPDWPERLGGIVHLPIEEQTLIEAQTQVPPHLCCSDPAWLFRIYQDTVVDIPSFQSTLKAALDEKAAFSAINFDKEMQHLTHDTIFPGKVENLECFPLKSKPGLNLSWQPPLNLQALEETDRISYEVWVQLVDQDDYKIFATNETRQVVRSLPPDNHVNVWVRGKLNDAKFGAFNWVSCKVESNKNKIDISY